MQRVTLDLSEVTFTRGVPLAPGCGFLGFQVNELTAENVRHTVLLFLDEGSTFADNLEWNVCDVVALPDGRVAVLGDLGELRIYRGPELLWELGGTPSVDGPLRGLGVGSNGNLWAFGTRLQVYSERQGIWHKEGPALDASGEQTRSERAFEHGVALPDGSLIAVGWDGEVWRRLGDRWTRADSPTSMDLYRVMRSSVPGEVIACGQYGTVLVGTAGTLQVVAQDQVLDHLWSVEMFQGRVFCASAHLVYELDLAAGTLAPMEASDLILPVTSGYLSKSADEVLWSVGTNQLAEWNGSEWRPLLEVQG